MSRDENGAGSAARFGHGAAQPAQLADDRHAPAPLAEDLEAAAAAGSELGGDYDRAVVRSLAERLDRELDARAGVRRSAALREAVTIVIALGSIGFGVLFAAATEGLGATGATVATIVAWVAIVIINVVHARSR